VDADSLAGSSTAALSVVVSSSGTVGVDAAKFAKGTSFWDRALLNTGCGSTSDKVLCSSGGDAAFSASERVSAVVEVTWCDAAFSSKSW
jgi:hypothetical protein